MTRRRLLRPVVISAHHSNGSAILTLIAAISFEGIGISPDMYRRAERGSHPQIVATWASVLSGQHSLQIGPTRLLTILSLVDENCPPISVATATGFPKDARMVKRPNPYSLLAVQERKPT